MAKFVQDDKGLYYNKKLEKVISEKKAYCKTQAGNLGEYKGLSREQIKQLKAEKAKKGGKPLPDASSTPGESNIPESPGGRAAAFHPPSVEEVAAYCLERKNTVDPFDFINFYESKGWMVGKNKMKDWKASVRHWETNDKKEISAKGIDRGQRPGQIVVDGTIPASFKKQ